jgi:hypothetical protein
MADYMVSRKDRISESALVQLASGESNFNREALVLLGVGMLLYLVIPASFPPGFSCFIVTCIVYVVIKLLRWKEWHEAIQNLG